MTTVRRSIPTQRPPLTLEQRIARAAKRAEEAALAAAEADAAAALAQVDADQALLNAATADAKAVVADGKAVVADGKAVTADGKAVTAQTTVNGALAGTTAFTGLLVGATNVKPFLDNTDGTKLTNTAGLGVDVVTTTKVLSGSITPPYSAFTAGLVQWAAESAEKTLQTVVVPVVRGNVRISGLADISSMNVTGSSSLGILRLKRDGVELFNAARYIAAAGGAGTWRFPGQVFLEYFDAPGAGTYTYTITFDPGEVVTGDIARRSLISQPQEG